MQSLANGGRKKVWNIPTYLANGDVWDEIEEIIASRPGKVEFQKVESRTEEDHIEEKHSGRTWAAKSGNDRADAIAGHAAQQCAVVEGTARSIYMWIGRAKRVQDRICTIEQEVARTRGTSKRLRPLGPKK